MDGKVCVVTGATSGIGQALAAGLASRGARVAIVGRNPAKLEATAAAIGGADTFRADLSLLAEVRRLADDLAAAYPDGIDVLMNNAGIHTLAARATAEDFDEMT